MNTSVKNAVQLVGNVGREIQIFNFDNGNKNVKVTQWHNLVAWGKTAELLAQNVQKGNEISVTGKLANRSYVSKDGTTKYVTEVVINEFFKIARNIEPVVEVAPF
jgi:single-strand DNA-binding protein